MNNYNHLFITINKQDKEQTKPTGLNIQILISLVYNTKNKNYTHTRDSNTLSWKTDLSVITSRLHWES